jgi:hypothetical protein
MRDGYEVASGARWNFTAPVPAKNNPPKAHCDLVCLLIEFKINQAASVAPKFQVESVSHQGKFRSCQSRLMRLSKKPGTGRRSGSVNWLAA